MSDLKVDGIIASTGTNTNLTLEGKGTGGVKITDYLVQTKGADIGSATSLTLGKDGNQFDVTGTTTITSIGTQGIGSYVTLHFDGILTFTHHSTDLILPGAANITTAAGDIAVMYEYASADWRCVSYTKASGAAVVAGGGAWNIIGTAEASGSASLTVTGLGTDYDIYAICLSALTPGTGNAVPYIRLGDSSGIDSASGDYDYASTSLEGDGTHTNISNQSATAIAVGTGDMGALALAGISGTYYLGQPSDSDTYSSIAGNSINTKSVSNLNVHSGGGQRVAALVHDRVQFLFHTGTITTGRLTVYGIAHA
jgi:hypothetical protein